ADDHYVISTVSDVVRVEGWAFINYAMLALPSGMLLAKFIFLGKTRMSYLLQSYVAKDINMNYMGGAALKYTVWLFTIISFLACLYTFYVIGYFPILKAFSYESFNMASTRIEAYREFSGNV